MNLKTFYADFHIHIGWTLSNRPVKITASNDLTIQHIFPFVEKKKGIDLIGIIDAHVPEVLVELELGIQKGNLYEEVDGGISNGKVTVLLGSEIEIYDQNCSGPIHVLCFFPTLNLMKQFSNWYDAYVKKPTLSSQRIYIDAKTLQQQVKQLDGLFIPAHVFTPFKSMYGKGVKNSLIEVFDPSLIDAVELGLSSDTSMAETISELEAYPFLTNSDAHSLEKIGREYQALKLAQPTFLEFRKALKNEAGRKIEANYGMNPKLGKYYETICKKCHKPTIKHQTTCSNCSSSQLIKGVSERIEQLSDQGGKKKRKRPPYIHQVPLEYVPGLGPKTLQKLRVALKNDMYIIHEATFEEIKKVSQEKIAHYILQLRHGKLSIHPGGGGVYGKVKT